MLKFIYTTPVKICFMNLRMYGMFTFDCGLMEGTLFIIYLLVSRSHLREIRDRSVLRLFESNEVTAPQVLPGGAGVPQPLPSNGGHWDQDQVRFILEIKFC